MDKLSKIKKLLRLAKSPNAHEAALALERAMDIARESNIDIATIDPDTELGKIVAEYVPMGVRIPVEKRGILNILNQHFNVTAVIDYTTKRIAYIGRESDIKIAHYVRNFLLKRVLSSFRQYAHDAILNRPCSRLEPRERLQYISGWMNAIDEKLRAKTQSPDGPRNPWDIVLVNDEADRIRMVSETHPDASFKKFRRVRMTDAYFHGVAEGEKISIHVPVEASSGDSLPSNI